MRQGIMRGVLHLLLGGAAAAALVGIGVGMALTVVNSSGAARLLTLLLAIASLLLVGRLLLTPVVRVVAAQLARLLLDAPVPELTESRDRQARTDAAVWSGIAMAVGGGCLFLLLFLVPNGLALVLQLGSTEPLDLGFASFRPGPVARVALALLGVVLIAAALAAQPAGVLLLRRWAPVWLRRSDSEMLAAQRDRTERLERSNALARDLHDSIGHALTAIGIQAEAALVADSGNRNPPLVAIRDTAHDAVAELDRVLGVLRDEQTSSSDLGLADIPAVLDRFPPGSVDLDLRPGHVDRGVGEAAYRIVQESVTNAVRHGVLPVRVRVDATSDEVEIEAVNRLRPDHVSGIARGTNGIRDRAAVLGGRSSIGVEGDDWVVLVRLPGGRR